MAIAVVLARSLSPQDAGIGLTVLSLTTIAQHIGQLGENLLIVENYAAWSRLGQQNVLWHLRVATLRVAIASAVAGLIVYGFAARSAGTLSSVTLLLLCMALTLFRALPILWAEYLRMTGDLRSASIHSGAHSLGLGALALVAVAWIGNPSVAIALAVLAAAAAVSAAAAAARVRRRMITGHVVHPGSSGQGNRALRRGTGPWFLWVASVALLILGNIDVWMASVLHGTAAAAQYGVALRVALLTGVSLHVVNATLVRPLAWHVEDRARLKAISRAAATLAAGPALLAVGTIIMFGETLLAVAFGEQYRRAWPLLLALSLGAAVSAVTGPAGKLLLVSGSKKVLAVCAASVTAATVATGLTIGRHSLLALAVVFAVGLAAQNIATTIVVRRRLGFWCLPNPRIRHTIATLRSLNETQ